MEAIEGDSALTTLSFRNTPVPFAASLLCSAFKNLSVSKVNVDVDGTALLLILKNDLDKGRPNSRVYDIMERFRLVPSGELVLEMEAEIEQSERRARDEREDQMYSLGVVPIHKRPRNEREKQD